MARRKMHLLIPNSITSICGMYTRTDPENDRNLTLDPELIDCKHCQLAYNYNKFWYKKQSETAMVKKAVRAVLHEKEQEYWIRQIIRDEISQIIIEQNKKTLEHIMLNRDIFGLDDGLSPFGT